MRVLSGIQPTGRFHWGNYFGAIKQYIELQHDHEGYYFIADLHALTTVRDAEVLRGYVRDAALDLLALGLDPAKATLFVQSDIPEVSELCWLLMTGTPLGLLERCHAYKDKKEKGIKADAGLFTYPVLMAADILAYDANWVPVGEDQVQHIEVCRDLARSFNAHYGEVFTMPEARIVADAAKVPGTDGEKMSKSYNNTLGLFEPAKDLRKKIMRISTDSRPMEDPKDPETDHLFQLYRLFATPEQTEEVREIYLRGGFGYGDIKKRLADAADAYLDPARARRAELEGNPDRVDQILREGAERARARARAVLDRAQRACGLSR
ncbi:Tryptophan--tRNA ligase [Pirellula sp. SH-Sr6A]|uniref:tryptophan--tRNA ligase n=1 Tax=Pirellula sp. SH-Sr6A TaxID=1632865 RepID=UPI00078BA75C|nr:tryptophan--tRNA ligase [Pirellula sp. SH-Sr6A]AMV32678.1 Tryptophan--tRNA ligase [Pirellula sp. SH-Sr6A]